MAAVGQGTDHLCTGAVVHTNWIAVAAHCIVGLYSKNLTIEIGVVDAEVLIEPNSAREWAFIRALCCLMINLD